jgi:hypothetical protein
MEVLGTWVRPQASISRTPKTAGDLQRWDSPVPGMENQQPSLDCLCNAEPTPMCQATEDQSNLLGARLIVFGAEALAPRMGSTISRIAS